MAKKTKSVKFLIPTIREDYPPLMLDPQERAQYENYLREINRGRYWDNSLAHDVQMLRGEIRELKKLINDLLTGKVLVIEGVKD